MNYDNLLSQKTAVMKSSMIRELVKMTKGIPGMISLAGGMPSPKSFPKQLLADSFRDVILEDGEDILQYGASDGDSKLKTQLKIVENMPDIDDGEILITSGSTHGIFLMTKTLVDDGDVILAESPSFLGSLVAFEAENAEVVGIDMDRKGMRADCLEQAIHRLRGEGKRIKFIYTIPEFQNPSGITMDFRRRLEILRIALDYEIPVLEDNPYGALRYRGDHLPSLFRLAREEFDSKDLVFLAKSFSKILGPGMRIAYIMGDAAVLRKMCSWMEKVNVTVDCVAQRAVARFLAKGLLSRQLDTIGSLYLPALDCMLNAMEKYMPAGVDWTRPEGGMFLWVELPEHINTDALFLKARDKKVAFIPGSKFYAPGFEKYNTMRLNFSYPTLPEIDEGVKRLGLLLKEIM